MEDDRNGQLATMVQSGAEVGGFYIKASSQDDELVMKNPRYQDAETGTSHRHVRKIQSLIREIST